MAVDRDSYLRHVFNTVAAYYATGGFAETSRKRIPSSPAYTSVDVGMANRAPPSAGGVGREFFRRFSSRILRGALTRFFPEGKDSKKRRYQDYRWKSFKNFEPRDMYTVVSGVMSGLEFCVKRSPALFVKLWFGGAWFSQISGEHSHLDGSGMCGLHEKFPAGFQCVPRGRK
jgi:hypothetical protein